LLRETGIHYIRGIADRIDPEAQTLSIVARTGERSTLSYDRLILAAGSQLHRPQIPGLDHFAFSIDQLAEAAEFDAHLHALAQRPESLGRDSIAIIGGGFTGIELATELPARLRRILGETAKPRIILIERADVIGPELGANPRPIIEQALQSQGVECRLGTQVTRITATGLETSFGETIPTETVVWTAGMRANPLTRQLPGEQDALGRVLVDRNLRLPAAPAIFAAGDVGKAATDDQGNFTLMSCQHALLLGRAAGHNAAADLLGLPNLPYRQPNYGTTLDLGPWGAMRCEGWNRNALAAGPEVKAMKQFINSKLIYPPAPDRRIAFEAANPLLDIAALKAKAG
jgi:NADH dehydrogenase